ncbi:MAG: hypothetical protein KBT89_16760 [Gammaproteobacteria bacterium]|nr:hypothetical protein [Gammaproteobacteria bacterium]
MKYGVHPSEELVEIFSRKPYQGADPFKSKVVVIGNDANYSPDISSHNFFRNIIDYHEDGVKFWQTYGVHHPFLLDDYPFDKRKGGVRYHSNFQKMGFESTFADGFSFVELLAVPTIGNTGSDIDAFFQLLDREHLEWLESVVFEGSKNFVLVNQTLAKNIVKISKRHGALKNLAEVLKGSALGEMAFQSDSVVIYNGYSFSHSVSNEYLSSLALQIRKSIFEE